MKAGGQSRSVMVLLGLLGIQNRAKKSHLHSEGPKHVNQERLSRDINIRTWALIVSHSPKPHFASAC